jgi:hypothetical protein
MVEAAGMRDDQIAHDIHPKGCLTLIAWVTPGGEEGPFVLVRKGGTYRYDATMRAAFTKGISEGKLITRLLPWP